MAQTKKKKNKFGISPSIILLNLMLVLIICTVCFFTYNIINSEDNVSSDPPFTAVTSAPHETTTDSSDTTKPESVPSSIVESTDNPIENTDSSSESTDNSGTSNENSLDFDKDYFDNSLFIGDSITTGLYLYGFLDESNVFAQQGLAPSTAMSADIDGVTIADKIASSKPEKIFVMLGTNSLGYGDTDAIAESMTEFINSIDELSTAKVYVLSIPPVTKEAEQSNENYLTNEIINDYNSQVKSGISQTNAIFLDFHSILIDSEGCFAEDYAEMDGIHFMGNTYKLMLSFLQKQTS